MTVIAIISCPSSVVRVEWEKVFVRRVGIPALCPVILHCCGIIGSAHNVEILHLHIGFGNFVYIIDRTIE